MHSTDELPKIKTVAHNDENFQVQEKKKKINKAACYNSAKLQFLPNNE